MSKISYIVVALFLCFFFAPSQGASKLPYRPTSAELLVLPKYCQMRLSNDPQARKQLADRIGREKEIHLHHFCAGLNFMNRARSPSEQRYRKQYLQEAIAEFNYVLRFWPADFELAKEAKTNKMLAESMVKDR